MSTPETSGEEVQAVPRKVRAVRLVKIAVGVTLAFVIVAVAPPWILARTTASQLRQIRLDFLMALLAGYLAVLAMTLVGGVVLGWLFWRQRRRGKGHVHPFLSRGL